MARKITEQDLVVLDYVYRNPGATTNEVYVNTVPNCVKTGRKKAQGTQGWTRPRTMQERGLVEIRVDTFLQDKAARNLWDDNKGISWNHCRHATRFLKRYHWYLTQKGKQIVLDRCYPRRVTFSK